MTTKATDKQAPDKLAPRYSRIGKRPVGVPKGVNVAVKGSTGSGQTVEVKGPKGTLSRTFPNLISVKQDGSNLVIDCTAPGRESARLQGLTRSLLANMVKGVSEGYERKLELHGTGYRAEIKGKMLVFNLGFSHPIEFPLPAGLNADVPKDSKGQMLILSCADKEVIGQASATIRGFRPPEPYGGKGVRFQGEKIREKAGKAGK